MLRLQHSIKPLKKILSPLIVSAQRPLHLLSTSGGTIPNPEHYPTQSPIDSNHNPRPRTTVDITKPYKQTLKTLLASELHWIPTPHITEFLYKPPVQPRDGSLEFVILKLHPIGVPDTFGHNLTFGEDVSSDRGEKGKLAYSLVHYLGSPGVLKKLEDSTSDHVLRSKYAKTLLTPYTSDLPNLISTFDDMALAQWRPRLLEILKITGKPLHWRSLKPTPKQLEDVYSLIDSEINNSNSDILSQDLEMLLGSHFANNASVGEIEDIIALNEIYPHEMERGFERLAVLLDTLVELRGAEVTRVAKEGEEWKGNEGFLEYWDEYAGFVDKIEIDV